MKKVRLVIGADHRGYAMKEWLKKQSMTGYSCTWSDVGAGDDQRSDYPLFAQAVCKEILHNAADYGILLCGTGIGMAITANRFKGIYAGLVWNEEIARLSKEDDNTNVLVFPSDFVTNEQALAMIKIWLSASFKEGRYQERLAVIDR